MIIYNASIHTMTDAGIIENGYVRICLLYTSPSPRD